jgi:hypothetical protein
VEFVWVVHWSYLKQRRGKGKGVGSDFVSLFGNVNQGIKTKDRMDRRENDAKEHRRGK